MRIEGSLSKWNDDRAFGFIAPTEGGPEVFVHISAFPKDGRRPAVGERLSFEIEIDRHGKKRAKNVVCPNRPLLSHNRLRKLNSRRNSQGEKRGLFGRVIPYIFLVAMGVYGYGEYSRRTALDIQAATQADDQNVSMRFHCDGRTYCSQMTSCAEATFFLRNCPNVKMDGNHNGVPCEQQWCTGPFAK